MSVWKSPVFYFGVILVMVIAFALMAPFTVNWNAWKPDMETYGRKLTGRDVSIAGPVAVRLFPWPRLEAKDVRLANAEGFGDAPLLVADAVTLRLSLAGLFSASVEVEEIAFESPQLNLVRDSTGAMNWTLAPANEFAGLMSRVSLDRITVNNGGVWFEDKLHDQSARLTAIDASVAAEAITGPWRMQGKGQWRDMPVALNFTLGTIEPGKPLRISATARPDDVELPGFALDGDWDNGSFAGKARVNAQQPTDGEKGSLEGTLRPLALQSDVEWTRDGIRFKKIKIAPSDSQDSGTLIEGEAEIALAHPPRARLQLDSPRVNLDTLLGAQSMARWQRGGLLALANGVFAELPEQLVAEFALDVNVLTLGGQSLNAVRLRGAAEKQAIRIHEATSELPGRSRMKFDGIIFPASTGAELGGTLAFESFDARDFAGWALPGLKNDLAAWWQGARGRLKLQTNLNWSPTRVLVQDAAYELDGQAGKAQGTWRFGEVPMIDAQIDMKALDLDSYLEQAASLSPDQLLFGSLAALPTVLDIGQKAEQRVTLQLESLKLNGATATNLTLDYEAGLSGLQLKALDIGALGGATIKGEGLVTNGQDGPLGEFDIGFNADDTSAALRMAGWTNAGKSAPWVGILGKTTGKLNLAIEPDSGKPRVSYTLTGQSGDVTLSATGSTENGLVAGNPLIATKFQASIPELSRLLTRYGLDAVASAGPLSINLELNGTRAGGLDAALGVKAAKGELNYKGKLLPDARYYGLAGVVDAKVESMRQLVALTGAPMVLPEDTPLQWQGRLVSKDGALAIEHVSGVAIDTPFEISANIDTAGRLSVDAGIGKVDLKQILAAVLMPWRGNASGATDSYADFAESNLSWQAFLKPSLLVTGFGPALTEAVIAIDANPKTRAINIKTPGKTLSFDLLMEPKGSSFAVTGQGEMALDIGQILRDPAGSSLATGSAKIKGTFNAVGQSPAAALTSAEGKGTYWVESLSLTTVTAQGFASGLQDAKQQVSLARVFDSLASPPGTLIGTRTGTIVMSGGEAKLTPFAHTVDDASMVLTPSVDLNILDVNVDASISSLKRGDLPPVIVTYSGVPGQMNTRVANAAMAAKLGYELLARELAALEVLQQQEAEAIRKQEQQRKDDEERFAAFQAQRTELRGQLRVLRFHQQERKRAKEEGEKNLAAAITAGDKLNKDELRRAIRLGSIRRALAEPFLQP